MIGKSNDFKISFGVGLINHVGVEALTTGRMVFSGTNKHLPEVSTKWY